MKTQANHLEIVCATKAGERAFWTRIGTAFPLKSGNGYRIKMNFIPATQEAEIILVPPGAKGEAEER